MTPHNRLYLDTNAIIAVVEHGNALSKGQRQIIEDIQASLVSATTSEITLMECLVKPLMDRDSQLVRRYLHFLNGAPPLPLASVDRAVLLRAAQARADLGTKLPDAVHFATAMLSGCTHFVSNDARLLRDWTGEAMHWSKL